MKRALLAALLLLPLAAHAQIKVNALPAASAVAGADFAIDDQGGVTKKATYTQVLAFVQANISVQCGTLPALTGVITSSGCTTSWAAATGTGSTVLATSPTLVTPALGTPTALVLTNATGTPTSIGLANGTGLPLATGVTGTLAAAQFPALTGDVTTIAGALGATIPAATVTLAKQANLAANSIQGNNTGSAAVPKALTVAQTNTLLGLSVTLTGTTGSIGGGVLLAGACASGTATVASSTTAMAVIATPVADPGDGATWMGFVSTNGTVTVKVCAIVGLTPTATTYNVRVIQ